MDGAESRYVMLKANVSWGRGMNQPQHRLTDHKPVVPPDRPDHFPQKVGQRIVRVGYAAIWPWVLMLLAGLLLLILRHLLAAAR